MSEPKNHHYVPKVYLKAFANREKLFFQATRQYKKVSQTSTSKVCYIPDYNRVIRKEARIISGVHDPLHLEKSFFKKQEDEYEAILKKIVAPGLGPFSLSRSKAKNFVRILTTIKRRNPSVRKILTDNYRTYINSSSFKDGIAPGIELAKQIDKIDPEKFVEAFLEEINSDSTRLNDTYLLSFINNDKNVTEKVINDYIKRKFFLLHAPVGSQFITSDNPGFTIVDDIVSNYGGLNDDFIFGFPLTPTACLIIMASQPEKPFAIQKTINIKHIQAVVVDTINKATAAVANERIFSYSRDVLNAFVDSNPNF